MDVLTPAGLAVLTPDGLTVTTPDHEEVTVMTYPNGYSGQLVTMTRLRELHGQRMHPEYARRLFACIEAADGLVGIGSGWRSTEAQRTLFLQRHYQVSSGGCCFYEGKRWALRSGAAHAAIPGSSFHESQTFRSGVVGYQAVDIVGRNGRHSQAQAWVRANEERFGLRSFWNVNNEPWHVQCRDIPLSVSDWKNAGRPDPSAAFVLPGQTPPPPPPPPEDDMTPLDEPYRSYDSRTKDGQLAVNEVRKVPVVFGPKRAHVNVTCITAHGAGWVSVAGTPGSVGVTSIINFEQRTGTQLRSGSVPLGLPDSHLYVKSTVPCHVIVDVFAVGA